MILAFVFVLAQLATPTPAPSPTAPPEITRVRVATGSPEALHRLPLPASLLTSEEIAATPALTGDELLRGLPGFDHTRSNSAFTNYGQLRVSFAGAGNDRGLVLVDGIPAQDGFGGQVDWAAYPSSDLTRAELLRGPGSALYGSGAIGGVLSLETFGPTSGPPARVAGNAAFAGGSHGYLGEYANARASLTPKLAVSVATSTQHLSYNDLPPAYQSPVDLPADSRASMLSLRARYAPDSTTSITYGYRGAWDVQHEGRPNYDFWRNLVQNSFGFAHSWKQASANVSLYERATLVTNRADKSSSPGTLFYTQYVPTHESGIFANWIIDARTNTFELRGDMRSVSGVSDQYDAANALMATGSGVQRLADLAVQETLRWRRAEVVTGLAATSISTSVAARTDRVLSPRIAVRYDLSPELALRASAGTGLRAPYLNELVRGYVIGPIAYRPNPNLVPERSSSASAGFDWQRGVRELSADFTQTFISDAISFSTISPTVQMRSNVARAQTDGITVSYRQRLRACSSLSLSATEQYARVTAGTPYTVGKQLPYVPKASASAGYDTTIGHATMGLDFSYLGQTYADDLNDKPLGTAVTASVHVKVPLRPDLALIVGADNVTNARYLSSIDRYGPPQTFFVGVSVPLAGTGTLCQ